MKCLHLGAAPKTSSGIVYLTNAAYNNLRLMTIADYWHTAMASSIALKVEMRARYRWHYPIE
jgi:hypothetical protein